MYDEPLVTHEWLPHCCEVTQLWENTHPQMHQDQDNRWANEPDKHQRVDTQMRQQYDQMLPSCPIPHLYGLSLLGTSLHIYCGNKATGKVTPHFADHPNSADCILSPSVSGITG